MKVVGIITEYNPFHKGHAYQIEQIKKETNADYVVIAMSGDFVQRGAPAIIDKYARTKMALSCGADAVFELPVLWATASAELFAMAGVTLFDRLGCVDALCFGAESDQLALLQEIADILVLEPAAFQSLLADELKQGRNFPTARANALLEYFLHFHKPSGQSVFPDMPLKELENLLSQPNNILALEYLKALKVRDSAIQPLLIKREGADYHSISISEKNASATAIRQQLLQSDPSVLHFAPLPSDLKDALPTVVYDILKDYLSDTPALSPDDFSSILSYLLLSKSTDELADVGDCNRDLANRLKKNCHNFTSFSTFCEETKSRDITYTRMSRILLHLILQISQPDYEAGKKLDYIPYLRLLGFRKSSSEVLSKIKETSSVPIISKLADASDMLPACSFWMLEQDIFAADLYEHTCHTKNISRSEYTRKIVILP